MNLNLGWKGSVVIETKSKCNRENVRYPNLWSSLCHVRLAIIVIVIVRYRLSAGVLCYPLPPSRARPPSLAAVPAAAAAEEPEVAKRRNLAKETASGYSAAAAAAAAAAGAGGGTVRGGAGGRPLATTTGGNDASEFVAAFDKALPEGMLSHLQVRQAVCVHNSPVCRTAPCVGGRAFVFVRMKK